MQTREKTVIAVLLGVLVLALLLMVVGTQRATSLDSIDPSTASPLPGRSLGQGEVIGPCMSEVDGKVVVEVMQCNLAVLRTKTPFWDVPLVSGWLPREARTLELRLSSPICSADLEFVTGDVRYEDVELDAETDVAQLAVRDGGGDLRIRRLGPILQGCRLELDLELNQ